MTFLHIHDQGLARPAGHALGERRIDHATAENIRDALRACGLRTAAQAMEYQSVSLNTALRVLTAAPGKRREGVGTVADAPARQTSGLKQAANQEAIPAFA